MRYAVVIECSEAGFGAYVPDLPGCIAVGTTREEALELIQHTIELHIESLKADGKPVPEPCSIVEYVELAARPVAVINAAD
jgi:predicted RNase H-like HicB family nuclease